MDTTSLDMGKVEAFAGQVLVDQAAQLAGVLTYIGDRLGIWSALAASGPVTPAELADRTGLAQRYLAEWLGAQAAGGYLAYAPEDGRFALPAEHALVLALEESPAAMAGGFEVAASAWADADRIAEAFRTGAGVAWGEHDHRLYDGTGRFYAAGYRAHLINEWLPALDGVVEKLERGARVLDVGCGHGVSTLLMAEAFPNSTFAGIDAHAASIEHAAKAAAQAGLGERVSFQAGTTTGYDGGWDLICFFDVLHDLGDPVGAAAHAAASLNPGGSVLLVEPRAGDRLEENLHPLGRAFYAASTLLCTPNAKSQDGGVALGAQAGPTRLRWVLEGVGFGTVRTAAETPVNLVIEARI